MKIKKRIINNWSLEAKDNYHLLREKVLFLDTYINKKRIMSKRFIWGLVSIFIVFLSVSFFVIGGGFNSTLKENDNLSDMPGNSQIQEPENDDNHFIKDENYELFLTEIIKPLIKKEWIYYVGYNNNLNQESTISEENMDKIIDYFNNLEYQICDKNTDKIPNLNSTLSFNNLWLKIYFDYSEFVIFEYSNQKILYKTNKIDIYDDLVNYLK